ncbi:MAG: serine/threonine-protein kinase [Polyangia bacterium]|jgi:serine/threonine-protein kinase
MQLIMAEVDPSPSETTPHTPAGSAAAAATAPFDPLVGTVLAERYAIVRRIGEGGMGAVYEARHAIIGKRVAVKVLLEKFLENQELIARLLQEARLASSIGHENIVDVTDYGTTSDGRAFVVMEFLDGESLAQLVMRDAPLPVERSLAILRQVCSALSAAHAKGIVHRDVKPENIYLVRRGELDFVKVVDFGVSKAVHSREEGADMQRLTRTGTVLGTPLYMSPEQARGGDDVDHRADIWSAGLMLYECLTGEVPFRANNYLGVISQVLTQETVPPSQLRPELGIPAAVDRVVMRALAKDREQRYQQMAEFEHDVERLLAGDSTVALREASEPSAAPAGHRLRWPLAALGVLALGVAVAVALAGSGPQAQTPVVAEPPKPALPVAQPTPAPQPTPAVLAPVPSVPERGRRVAKPHGSRAASAVGSSAPVQRGKKSKADDTVAPSPYQSDD